MQGRSKNSTGKVLPKKKERECLESVLLLT